MLTIHTQFQLKEYNTFGIQSIANKYIEATTVESLKEATEMALKDGSKLLILGGGANILFSGNFAGTIVRPNILGIEVAEENEHESIIRVGAGVDWDSFVEYTVSNGLYGLENLSLIPGSVGASPIQNIGAYGVEVKTSIKSVEGFFIENLEPFELTGTECNFGYRDSIFKNKLKRKVIISHVTFRLSKTPNLITYYGSLDTELERLGDRTLANVRNAVINIRNSKLPNPKELGNAGSFFKNPAVDISLVKELQKRYEKVPFYPVNEGAVKLPAGWLIEQAGWKGKRDGNVGVHKDQALVLVNYGNATGAEVVALAHKIRQSVMELFNISLEMEVNVV